MKEKASSLYIHIPFCAQKCAYCDFVSFAADFNFRKDYLLALCMELKMIGEKHDRPALRTIFVGGGTPSLLNVEEIELLGKALNQAFVMAEVDEFSIEANPGTVETESLGAWRSIGVNRISMGVQSMNDNLLKKLGRIHTSEVVRDSFRVLRESGFDNINLDIMFGLPDQTVEDMHQTVDEILELGPEHISAYSLKVEEGTPFDRLVDSGNLTLPSEEEDREMYHGLIESLAKAGYAQYEISNFAKDGRACKHNLVYWKGKEYYAAGMAAHGYVDGIREGNFIDWLFYKEALEKGERPIMTEEPISVEDAAFEYIMLGLRLNDGVDLEEYKVKFGNDLEEQYESVISEQLMNNSIAIEDGFMRLTEYGMDIANSVIAEFME